MQHSNEQFNIVENVAKTWFYNRYKVIIQL